MPTRNGKVASCFVLVLATLLSASTPLFAAGVTVTGGTVDLYWDGSPSGFTLTGPQTQISADFSGGTTTAWSVGQTADLSSTVRVQDATHLRTVTISGTTYSSVFLQGSLTFQADPFTVPPSQPTFSRLAARFTVSGLIEGYSDSAFTTRVFSTTVDGVGVADFRPSRFIAASNTYCACGGGGTTYTLTGPEPAGWTSTDVGGTGRPGNDGITAQGTTEVGGAGSDIWGASDSFRFVAVPLAGDGTIVARVINEQNTNEFAKAGIMIRQSTSDTAAHVTLDVKPGRGVELLTRSQNGGSTQYAGGVTVTSTSVWLRLARTGSQVAAAVSSDGQTWSPVGSTALAGPALVGLAVTSHVPSEVNQAAFDHVTVSTASTGTLSAPWKVADIGAVGLAGSASGSPAQLTVSAAGSDIWGSSDSFSYVYQPFTADGGISTQVSSIENTSAFAKAGVMLRASTAPDAVSIVLDVKPDGGIEFMARSATGGQTTFIAGTSATFPVTLDLSRSGSTVFAKVSSSSGLWTQIIDLPSLPLSALLGMAVTSHAPSRLTTSVFDTVATSQNLVANGGFELSTPPSPGPGWVSDTPVRQIDAVSATTQPRSGSKHGECLTQTGRDCGLFQDITLPESGDYVVRVYANTDVAGAYVGINAPGIRGGALSAPVRLLGFGNYDSFESAFSGNAGDTVRVWLYAPASPGTTVIDDVELVRDSSE